MGNELRTARLRLRPFRPEDASAFATFAADGRYLEFLGPAHPEPTAFVSRNVPEEGAAEARELGWVICGADDGDRVVGSVFLGVDPTDEIGELACLVAPDSWALGIGTEAAAAVLDYAFEVLELAKVYARAMRDNIASIRGMERLGMHREALLRAHRVNRAGERVDEVVYGILRDEWEPGPA